MQMNGTGVRCILVREYNPTLRNGTNRIRRSAHLQKIKLYIRFTPSRASVRLCFYRSGFFLPSVLLLLLFSPAYLYTLTTFAPMVFRRDLFATHARNKHTMYMYIVATIRGGTSRMIFSKGVWPKCI